jgi:glycosyltransferase involved in cell wall biosynthesis
VKVLLVSSHGADRFYGGAERYVHDLRTGLESRGHAVEVLSAFPIKDDASPAEQVLHDVDWRDSRVRRARNHAEDWLAGPFAHLREALQDREPDLVHTNNLPGISTGIWECARRLGLPVVHTLHDYYLLCPRVSLTRRDGTPCQPHPLLCGVRTRRLHRWTPGLSAVIGVSRHVLARHGAFFPASTVRRVILPPLVPVGKGDCDAPSALSRLGYVGALTESKGVRTLLAAAARLGEQGVSVAVAGGGPLEDEVRQAPGIDYRGRLSGREVADFLAACDAGVIPSLWEEPGLTFAALEWMAARRPILTSGRGGLAELDPGAGVLTFDGTPEGLVAAVAAVRSPEAWDGVTGKVPVVRDSQDLERWISDHLAVYDLATVRGTAAA